MLTQNDVRVIEVERAYNVRDLGGYEAKGQRRTLYGRVLRADSIHALSPESQTRLRQVGLKAVIDLRSDYETTVAKHVFTDVVGRSSWKARGAREGFGGPSPPIRYSRMNF